MKRLKRAADRKNPQLKRKTLYPQNVGPKFPQTAAVPSTKNRRGLGLSIKNVNVLTPFVRLLGLLKQHGISAKKFEKRFQHYLKLVKEHDAIATFAITADSLRKNNRSIKNAGNQNVEYAIHGYKHVDYSKLSYPEHLSHLEKAVNIFNENDITFKGFRCPYLKYNENIYDVLNMYGVPWDSSYGVYWEVLNDYHFRFSTYYHYVQALGKYNFRAANQYVSIPKLVNSIVEIPVSLPDDELLTGCLKIKNKQTLSKIWNKILQQTYKRGELFTMQLHPERIRLYDRAIHEVIQAANQSNPQTWLTSLNNIAEWWNEKRGFSADIDKIGDTRYRIQVQCSERATILVKTKGNNRKRFYKNYDIIRDKTFTLESSRLPIVGVPQNCSPRLIAFLKNEGFLCERGHRAANYAVFLNDFANFKEGNELKVLRRIDRSHFPLIRFWRWPEGYRSALAITGEIDGITAGDFIKNVLH